MSQATRVEGACVYERKVLVWWRVLFYFKVF